MSPTSKREYIRAISQRYRTASRLAKQQILTEVCATMGYHRKAAIRVLNRPPDAQPRRRHRRAPTYGAQAIALLVAIWEAAGYPWSVRLKALLPLWLPWATQRFAITPPVARQVLTISPRTLDRRLQTKKTQLRRRLYGRTKPGTLLKHHIPIKTDRWDVTTPGFTEVDLVAHSGNAADGEFKKDDNAHIEQKNWTHVRKLLGWDRYDSPRLWRRSTTSTGRSSGS